MSIDKLKLFFPNEFSDNEKRDSFLKFHRIFNYSLSSQREESTLIEYRINNQAKSLKHLSEILLITNLLKENNIAHIFLKGVLLSKIAYGDYGIRECRDIDVIIEDTKVEHTIKLLEQKGYILTNKTKHFSSIKKKYDHNISLWKNEKKILVELHWRFFTLKELFPANEINKISNFINLDLHEFSVLKNEYYLNYLCTHGAVHLFSEIIWILDIAKYIESNFIDWNNFKTISYSLKNYELVQAGLFLAKKYFDSNIPDDIIVLNNKTKKLIFIIEKLLNKNQNTFNYRICKFRYYFLMINSYVFWWKNIEYRLIRFFS